MSIQEHPVKVYFSFETSEAEARALLKSVGVTELAWQSDQCIALIPATSHTEEQHTIYKVLREKIDTHGFEALRRVEQQRVVPRKGMFYG